MSKYETYMKVRNHLLLQGERSVDNVSDCAYRGTGGLMCAVGILIPDEVYQGDWEGTAVGKAIHSSFEKPVRSDLELFLLSEGHDLDLLRRLQCIHDRFSPKQWRYFLDDLAVEYGFEIDTKEGTDVVEEDTCEEASYRQGCAV